MPLPAVFRASRRIRPSWRSTAVLAATLVASATTVACTPLDLPSGIGGGGTTTPTATSTATPTATSTPTTSPTATTTAAPTGTSTPTATSTATPTATPTATVLPTTTPTTPTTPPDDGTLPPSASGRYLWVAADGRDTNPGAESAPLRTLQKAADLSKPGDTVLVRTGNYSAVTIRTSGTATKPITFSAAPGQQPVIRGVDSDWNLVSVIGSYINFQRFSVVGNAPSISLAEAMAHKTDGSIPRFSQNCISVNGRIQHASHVVISGNTVRDCSGGGIGSMESDYITIKGNTVSGCSKYSPWGTSPVGYLTPFNSDNNTGIKMVFEDNEIFGNMQLVPWKDRAPGQNLTEGHGVILDSGKTDKGDGPYRGRTLIKNNRIHDNGGSAVNVFNSNNADVIGNTTAHNRTNLPGGSEITVSGSTGVRVADNTITPSAGIQPTSARPTTGVTFENNH